MTAEPAKITFGIGLDKFKIGMGVSEAITVISNDYPRLNFEINFPPPDKVLNREIMICLLDWGVRLRFQPVSQRLFMIDCYDISLRKFSIKGSSFGGDPTLPVTFEMMHKYLGPTLPGQLIEDDLFLCNFGGASFLFEIPTEHLAEMKSHLPVTFADGSSASLVRIFLYPMELDISMPKAYPDMLSARVLVVLKPDAAQGYAFHIYPTGKGAPSIVELGMPLQDIITMLGDPAVAGINAHTNSYRYEYPKLGMEFYFSEATHVLFQVVLRNNLAHSSDFGRFERCPFRIYYTMPSDELQDPSNSTSTLIIASPTARASNVSTAAAAADHEPDAPLEIDSITFKTSSKKKKAARAEVEAISKPGSEPSAFDVIIGPSNESAFIDPLTTDTKIRELMSCWFGGSAMTREASAQLPAPQGSPFSDTLLYSYPEKKICFEVTGSDPGNISSVSFLDLELIQSSIKS